MGHVTGAPALWKLQQAAPAAAAAITFLWNRPCQNQPCFYLLCTGNTYKGLTSVLLATCTVKSESALILAVPFFCGHSLNNPGHCCNVAAISLSRKKVKVSLRDRDVGLHARSLEKLDFNKMLRKTSEESKSAAVSANNTG